MGVPTTALGTADGAAPTWDDLVDAVGRLRDANEEPGAQILADRTARVLAKQREAGTTGPYLAPPTYLDGVKRLPTGQVSVTQTEGTATDASDIFTGDFSKLLIGLRAGLQISVLKERYADTRQVGLVAHYRGDVGIARLKAFDVVTGVLGG